MTDKLANLYMFELIFNNDLKQGVFYKFGYSNNYDATVRFDRVLEDLNKVLPTWTGRVVWAFLYEKSEVIRLEKKLLKKIFPKIDRITGEHFWFEQQQCFKPYNIGSNKFSTVSGRSEIRKLNERQLEQAIRFYQDHKRCTSK